MLVSVIIPTYKPGPYLEECLQSIRRQSLHEPAYEIIIVLNGCKEPYYSNIIASVRQIFGENSNIRIIQTDFPGVSNARNIGIDCSLGEYLTFIDDDDIISTTYLEELLKISSPTCVGCSNSYAFIDNISQKRDNFLSRAFRRCENKAFSLFTFRQFLSPPCVKLFHREIIGNTRFPISIRKSEDSVFCLMLSPKIKNMRLTTSSSIYYQRLREGSVMRTTQPVWSTIKEHIRILSLYFSVWLKNPFRYNLLFFLSRILACINNCRGYIMH